MMIKAGIIRDCIRVPMADYAEVFHIQGGVDATR
jgi:hypothetical protein